MANNLRKFNTVADYQAAQLNYPAVSWITATDGVYFDKTAPTPTFGGLTVYYDIEDPSVEISLFNGGGDSSGSGGGGALPTTMIVDGNSETPIATWRFQTAGEHIVQYTFEDNNVPEAFLDGLYWVKEVVVGTDIVGIGNTAFNLAMTSATCLSTTPPSIGDTSVFANGWQDYPIYVPASAVDTYKNSTSTGWNEYASRIQAIQ